ncbi:MAG: hypothetical protein KGN00_11545 [Chloroflexota bacterium]|nr:hypothetical protein [Chloroflexota bacterium]MDE3194310.1 hypothetical protein [Chloroflexota bacterium]
METPVAYECTAPAHQVGEGGPDKLTIHDGQWAFCPFDAKAGGHEWRPTGGVPLAMLRHTATARRTDPVEKRADQ